MKEQAQNTPKRLAGGQFAPGVSGNPRGRPKGSRDKKTLLLQKLVDDDGDVVVRRLLLAARAGEEYAVRLVVERLLPKRERRVDVDLARVETAGDVARAVADVIDLVASSDLTIEEGRALLQLVDVQRRAIETSELAVRLELLEAEQRKEGF